ncbi:MAG: hypothetical protein K8W52_41850 [Deltaproteobacteria bacterium]|nr:hypothetical protein [Deltaproteobacteria bacterium]
MRRILVVAVAGAAIAAPAVAAPGGPHRGQIVEVRGPDGVARHADQYVPPAAFTASALGDPISPIIFMNRCTGGCTLTASSRNDARTNETTIPSAPDGTTVQFPAFPFDDATWQAFMACAREVYSPYDVTVTDVDPGTSVIHHEVIVAGTPDLVGLGSSILGIAPVAGDCLPKNNNISFDFAANHTPNDVLELCATATHESAHSWGLDHEFDCTDPMTYLTGCGEKFFRNRTIVCGEFEAQGPRDCACGPGQNSHAIITSVFGAGQTTVPPPTADILSPRNGEAVTAGFSVFVDAHGKRGVARIEVWINGYRWAAYTPPTTYASSPFTIAVPAALPDGILDLEARAYDDLDAYDRTTITVTKGAPCTTADTCATGQVCTDGKCHWDSPTRALGDACAFPQECVSGVCQDLGGGGTVCTQPCFTGIDGQCPASFACASTGGASGFCAEGGGGGTGGCSAGQHSATEVASHLGVIGLVGAIAFRRRRRR